MLHSGLVDWITTPMIRNHQKQLPKKKLLQVIKTYLHIVRGKQRYAYAFKF
jgi:hypothetical protein